MVVSRINLSPRFMRELIDAMEDNFSKWQTREGIRDLPEFGPGGQRHQHELALAALVGLAASRSAPASSGGCRTGT